MDISKSNNANVQLLTCLVELQDTIDPDDSHYRFELLPPFPPGNWNKGYMAKDPETGEAALHQDRDRVPCWGGKRLASSEAE